MDLFYEFGLIITRHLQTSFPQLKDFLILISTMGIEEFYMVLFPLIYWCIHKKMGKNLIYLFLLSNALNLLLKVAFRGARPFWFDPGLEMWEEKSFGVPSWHVETATLVYMFFAIWIRRWWAWVFAFLMIFLMGISRIYLGSHFPHDVIVGFVISILLLLAYVICQHYCDKRFEKLILRQKLLLVILIPIIYTIIYSIVQFVNGTPNIDIPWTDHIPAAELVGKEGIATTVGMLLGAGIGLVFEGSRIQFRVNGNIWMIVVRYLIGISVTILIWAGLKAILPSNPLWLELVLRVLRYFLVALWITYYAPWLFVKSKLAPGIDLKIRN